MSLIASYSESNLDNFVAIGISAIKGGAQAFTATAANLTSVRFYGRTEGSPTGNAVARLYAHTGVSGVTSIPTGAALASSDNFDVTTFTGSDAWHELVFTGANQYSMSNATKYVISFEYAGAADDVNFIRLGWGSTGIADNYSRQLVADSSWIPEAARSFIFEVYGNVVVSNPWNYYAQQ